MKDLTIIIVLALILGSVFVADVAIKNEAVLKEENDYLTKQIKEMLDSNHSLQYRVKELEYRMEDYTREINRLKRKKTK